MLNVRKQIPLPCQDFGTGHTDTSFPKAVFYKNSDGKMIVVQATDSDEKDDVFCFKTPKSYQENTTVSKKDIVHIESLPQPQSTYLFIDDNKDANLKKPDVEEDVEKVIQYHFEKFKANTPEAVKATLDKHGVAIVPSVLDEKECQDFVNGAFNYIETIAEGFKRDDTKTYSKLRQLGETRT